MAETNAAAGTGSGDMSAPTVGRRQRRSKGAPGQQAHWYTHVILVIIVAIVGFPLAYAMLVGTQTNQLHLLLKHHLSRPQVSHLVPGPHAPESGLNLRGRHLHLLLDLDPLPDLLPGLHAPVAGLDVSGRLQDLGVFGINDRLLVFAAV